MYSGDDRRPGVGPTRGRGSTHLAGTRKRRPARLGVPSFAQARIRSLRAAWRFTGNGTGRSTVTMRPGTKERAITQRLRLGLLLDSLDVPVWVWTAIRELTASSYAQIVVVTLNHAPRQKRQQGWLERLRSTAGRLLERVDVLTDRRIPAKHDAFRSRDARPLLAGIPILPIDPAPPDASETFGNDDVARLRTLDLDVLVRFGFEALRGEILDVARSGVWAFRHGDEEPGLRSPVGFWEVHDVAPLTVATLRILSNGDAGDLVLARTTSTTVPTSLRRNRNALYWKALPLLPRALQRLQLDGDEAFRANVNVVDADPGPRSKTIRPPEPVDLAVHAVRRFGRLVSIAGQMLLKRQQWVLFYALADDLVTDGSRLRPLIPPIDRMWADPHVVQVGDRYFVFIEELEFGASKGRIAVIEIDNDGRASSARTVLEEDHHLSYPFVFEHDGDLLMIPESSERRTIDLYRATSFPDRWTFVEHLMTDLHAVDATVFRERDRWWLFASVTVHRGAHSGELNLYSSEQLTGGAWRLHPASPVSSDVSNSRPAGAILRRGGRLVRPAQDGSGAYGRAIRLQGILELSEDAYREREIGVIEATWDPRITRTHTLAHVGRLTVLDALWPRWRWSGGSAARGSIQDRS